MLPSVQPLTELLPGSTWVYITPIRGWPERREVLRRIVVMYTRNHYPFALRRERVERGGTGSLSLCRAHRNAKGRVIHQVLKG